MKRFLGFISSTVMGLSLTVSGTTKSSIFGRMLQKKFQRKCLKSWRMKTGQRPMGKQIRILIRFLSWPIQAQEEVRNS